MNGFLAILLKELAHIRRDRGTILFAFVIPAVQLSIFGYAIDVTIENIPLVVFDLDGRQESRRLVEAFVNTRTFKVVERVTDSESLHRALNAGRAKAGLIVPADYSNRLLRGEQAQVQMLIDGSDSQIATTALNAANLLTINMSLGRAKIVAEQAQRAVSRDPAGRPVLPIEARPRLLYNPDLESSHFFVPGLIGIILQLVLLFLTSFSIVRERERGTLEQLFVTPVGRGGLLFGKLVPYACMAFGELCIVLTLMVAVFGVNINGSLLLLFSLSGIFIVTVLGLGLLISTIATTQLGALQMAFMVMLPSVLLSGFMFPRSEMPTIIYWVTFAIPATYYIEILRGVILRGADLVDLFPHFIGLCCCCAVILTLSLARFRKQLD
ncbi:MAG TPA: ABC transporter permease [Phycisphaerae bacterium]|nr:ABC transporter permease [Phycisphaerae bacterium]